MNDKNGIRFLKEPDDHLFIFLPGKEEIAAKHLISCLRSDNANISLMNDEDESGEGMTTFIFKDKTFFMKMGGHGWQGQETPIEEGKLLKEIVKLAPFNMGKCVMSAGHMQSLPKHKGLLDKLNPFKSK